MGKHWLLHGPGRAALSEGVGADAAIRAFYSGGQQGGFYDPSDLSTLFKDTAGTIPVTADGDLVARINDKSGNGNHLLQATSTKRPMYKTSGGRHWLESDGIDDFMQAAISGWSDLTAVVAHAYLLTTGGLLGMEISAATRANALWQMATTSPAGTYLSVARGAAFSGQALASYSLAVDTPEVSSSRLKQDDFQFWRNGGSLGTDTSGTWPASTLTVIALFAATGGGSAFGQEKFFGGVFRSPVLSAADRQTAEAFLAGKSGATL